MHGSYGTIPSPTILSNSLSGAERHNQKKGQEKKTPMLETFLVHLRHSEEAL